MVSGSLFGFTSNRCFFGIFTYPDSTDTWYVGQNFLRKKYIVLDMTSFTENN